MSSVRPSGDRGPLLRQRGPADGRTLLMLDGPLRDDQPGPLERWRRRLLRAARRLPGLRGQPRAGSRPGLRAQRLSPTGRAGPGDDAADPVSYTHLRAHETDSYLVCRLLLEKKKKKQ